MILSGEGSHRLHVHQAVGNVTGHSRDGGLPLIDQCLAATDEAEDIGQHRRSGALSAAGETPASWATINGAVEQADVGQCRQYQCRHRDQPVAGQLTAVVAQDQHHRRLAGGRTAARYVRAVAGFGPSHPSSFHAAGEQPARRCCRMDKVEAIEYRKPRESKSLQIQRRTRFESRSRRQIQCGRSRATSSPRLRTPTLANTDFRWSCTVWAEMNRRPAMSVVECPAITSRQMSRSRSVNP